MLAYAAAGHSLGGALATLAAYDLVQRCPQLDSLRQVRSVGRCNCQRIQTNLVALIHYAGSSGRSAAELVSQSKSCTATCSTACAGPSAPSPREVCVVCKCRSLCTALAPLAPATTASHATTSVLCLTRGTSSTTRSVGPQMPRE